MTDENRTWTGWLDGGQGEEYWRGLEELMATREFREAMEREFPAGAAESPGPLSRRTFVKLVGAQIALAGLTGCFEPPADEIVPYVERPLELTPGEPQYYATSMVLDGYATGLLVESHGGRPTKVEGNPEHPASLGAAGVFEQASLLQLYDPHRTRAPTRRGRSASWSELRAFLDESRSARGAGVHFLLGPTSSPSLARLIDRVRESYPQARVEYYAPLWTENALAGTRAAFGRPLQTQHDFSAAKVVLSLEADFLAGMPFHLRYAPGFTERRRLERRGPSPRVLPSGGALMAAGHLQDHFESLERQTEAARLGMWVFLGSEVLFFGVLFALYASYRVAHGHAFSEGVHHNDLVIGTVNTYILLTSSLIVALGIYTIRSGRRKSTAVLLGTAAVLGVVFLALKGLEYSHHFREGIFPGHYYEFERLQTYGARVFFTLYYFMTGLHALHVFGGIIMLLVLAWLTVRKKFDPGYHTPIELGGMYWHFVDIVWLFLWPLFYLLR